jgi:hypothetical protein
MRPPRVYVVVSGDVEHPQGLQNFHRHIGVSDG